MGSLTREQQAAQAAGATHWWDGYGVVWQDGKAPGWRAVYKDGTIGARLTVSVDDKKVNLPNGVVEVQHVPGLRVQTKRRWAPYATLNDRLRGPRRAGRPRRRRRAPLP
ncbi:MAG: hypothetical protein NT029_07570 [Armatimonadetes bacterium]|nr:hypothetical protein [Armatimonadota bacterium]